MKRNTRKKGFTIVELVIVIAAIAILTAVMIPTFSAISKKAKISSDTQVVKMLNTSMSSVVNQDNPKTMTEALAIAEENGFNVQKLSAKEKTSKILWDSVNNVYCYLKEGQTEPEYDEVGVQQKKSPVKDWEYWVISKTVDTKYSTYYIGTETDLTGTKAVTKGFDVGTSNVTNLEYKNTNTNAEAKQEVVIRTNGGKLTVDASKDTIYHYGQSNEVEIISVAATSFHEFAKTTFIKVAEGRVVVAEEAQVGGIHVTANNVIVAVEETKELPAVTFEAEVTTFKVQTTNDKGVKATESVVTVENNKVAVAEGVPAAVKTAVETAEVATEDAAKEKTAEVVTPTFSDDKVACIGWDAYVTLEDAFNAAKAIKGKDVTIKVLKDSTGNGLALYTAKGDTGVNITIDFNSYTYDVNANTQGSTGTKTQGFHFERGSADTDNNVTLKNGTVKTTSTTGLMLIQNYCNLTLDNMVVDGRNPNATVNYALSNNNGTILIKDTTIIAYEGQYAFDVCRYSSYKSVNVTVEGKSVINGKIELSVSAADVKDGASLTLNGGDFSNATINNGGNGQLVEVSKADTVSITIPGWVLVPAEAEA